MTIDEFLRISNEKFGNKFKFHFSNPNVFNQKTFVNVECNIHGFFNIRVDSFLRSPTGCIICSKQLRNLTKNEFQRRVTKKFPNVKIISCFDKISCNEEIEFFCKKCGSLFKRTRTEILNKDRQCPTCMANEKLERSYKKRFLIFEKK